MRNLLLLVILVGAGFVLVGMYVAPNQPALRTWYRDNACQHLDKITPSSARRSVGPTAGRASEHGRAPAGAGLDLPQPTDGRITVGQWPNLPLWLFIGLTAVGFALDPAGTPAIGPDGRRAQPRVVGARRVIRGSTRGGASSGPPCWWAEW